MTTISILLPRDLRAFVGAEAAAKGYGTADEYVCELIRATKKEAARERLKALLLEGLDSGEPVEVTPKYWDRLRQEARRRLADKGQE